MPGQIERTTRRPYESALRRQQAAATRAQIAAAARRCFAAQGWTATRVRDVAAEAGVAEATVYATYGTKAGLALALVDAAEASADVVGSVDEMRAMTGDPTAQLAALVSSDCRLFDTGGDVIVVLREAGPSEPELRAAYEEGRARGDRLHRDVFNSWPADTFQEGANPDLATDTYAALCNIDVYRVLTVERAWTAKAVERWWTQSLGLLLLRS